jgi:CheY-like chemotaxis protein
MRQRILVVDDDPSLAEMLTIVLRNEGFETAVIADGSQALTAVRELRPDLVLLDLMLPGMNGIDVCRVLRSDSGVPIVMLTAKTDTVDVVLGLESGADDYIMKPFKPKELVARVRARLRRNEDEPAEMLSIADIAAIADIGRAAGSVVLVDNTFASPALQQPLTLGADIVLHSTTKYIGGHSDVVGGALVTNSEELDTKFAFLQNGAGAVPGPFDAYLTMRGLKTLELRMARHCDNAAQVAEFLAGHPAVSQVLYPGLVSHPGHAVAARQMRGFGGMVSVRMRGGVEAARDLCSRTEIFILAESLGGVESLIEHPGAMTHASTAGSQLEVPDDLVRLSVGIEDPVDLLADLRGALAERG